MAVEESGANGSLRSRWAETGKFCKFPCSSVSGLAVAVADGRRRELTTLELVALRLRQDALQGSTRAFKEYKTLEAKFGQQESAKKGGYLLIPTVGSWDDWVRLFGPKEVPRVNDDEA